MVKSDITTQDGAETITYYPSRQYVDIFAGGTETVQKYYVAGGKTIAENTTTSGVTTLNWMLSNQVNSTTVTANADGTWHSAMLFTAFGEVRATGGTSPTQFQFTGQLNQPEIGLSWYASRFYDPYLTHFVQPDSIIPGLDNKNVPTDGIAWDHYAYVDFNPITRNDPSGHRLCDLTCQQQTESIDPQKIRQGYWISDWNIAQQKANSAKIASVANGITNAELSLAPPLLILYKVSTGDKITGLDAASTIIPAAGEFAPEVSEIINGGEGALETSGQWHHIITTKMMNILDDHKILSGIFNRDDLLVQAVDQASHNGYFGWHQTYDDNAIAWLTSPEGARATASEFLGYLKNVYSSTDMQNRFPGATNLLQMAIEELK